jgi:signal transduction histidine kinase
MKLRNRLFVSTSVPLVVMGIMLATAYAAYRTSVAPDLMAHLEHKATSSATSLGAQLDVPLGAADPAMVAEAVAATLRDPDVALLEVVDAGGVSVFRHGDGGTVAAAAAVSLEGVALGRVHIRYSTARIDRLDVWAERLALFSLLVWLAALAYSLRFSRAFVAPLRRMMDYSRRVARGHFTERLTIHADGELGELERDLDVMATELHSQEQERRRAAKRVEAMQQELLSVSRMAGMAEIATGVLHNVGNVLNSLNTSVTVVSSVLKGSKVNALSRGVGLYRDYPGGLGAFLATDKGKLLPQYFDKVSAELAAENADALGELESITRNVQHIATIVSTQQAYTKIAAVHEPTDVSTLCDDALHMVEGSFQRHGVTLVKEYRPSPFVTTDRHKVLQILVNLVSNARHALNESQRTDKRLEVFLGVEGDDLVVRIADNGVGIPAANLDRIFQHGFTTKKQGHGFGLHSAANAAGELGGRLSAASDGPDRGATFTLVLPLQPQKTPDDAN